MRGTVAAGRTRAGLTRPRPERDALVNDDGITHACEFLDLDEADFDRVLAVNLESMFLGGEATARARCRTSPIPAGHPFPPASRRAVLELAKRLR